MSSLFDKFDLTGKTVLITGGATGIGFEMTKVLARSGAKVMMAARREDVLKDAADKLMSEPDIDEVLWHKVDLANRDSVKALSKHAQATLNGVDIFIGNAGMEVQQTIEDITDDALDEQIRANLTSNIELTRALLPHMKKQNWGRFIYCSSNASILASANDLMSVYGTVKSGLNSFSRFVAAEGGRFGITANCLLLGVFMTDMLKEHLESIGEEGKRGFFQEVPSVVFLGRPALTEEISGLTQLLASDAGGYISGANLAIDGGMAAALRPNPITSEQFDKLMEFG